MGRHEAIDRREEGEADAFFLAGGFNQHDQRRQQRNAERESDDHAHAGDQAEFADADVIRGQEREESRRRRRRRQRQRRADPPASPFQGSFQVAAAVPLRSVAHRELDGEIDAEAYEQGDEGDGDDVESADRHQAQRHRQRQTRGQCRQDAEDDAERAHRQPQR